MAWLQTTFTVRYNRKHRRCGHLFQGRYRAELVGDAAYGRKLVLYIHLNPIRSRAGGKLHYIGNGEDLNAYAWSSHPDYAGLRNSPLPGLSLQWRLEWGPDARGYLKALQGECGASDLLDWKAEVQMGLVAGEKAVVERVKRLLVGRKRETGARENRRLRWDARRNRLQEALAREPDLRIRLWARVRLLGERKTDLAKEWGYRDSSGVYVAVKRLEMAAKKDKQLAERLKAWEKCLMS
jgi:hypothetical protein